MKANPDALAAAIEAVEDTPWIVPDDVVEAIVLAYLAKRRAQGFIELEIELVRQIKFVEISSDEQP